ncbi:recombination regulator RecX [Nitrosomonas aestuarii]|uniref:recombination regulator RecX n=1 Tax=Nitrosomonas aestuarii TaxID=52441 RepID=UPI000D3247E3|nr:recombination regulator RecX [Nitrosomonas aestuarii]PTN09422.1 regulatory protein [Nitrosomonas aestuarii]
MNDKPTLETRALRYLARREYSRFELEKKLSAHASSPQSLINLLDQLELDGCLSAERFVEQATRTRRARFGSRRIVRELKDKGIEEHLIAQILPDLKETDFETALHIWQKKFGAPPDDLKARGRQIRFLINRGFSSDIIRQVLLQAEKERI